MDKTVDSEKKAPAVKYSKAQVLKSKLYEGFYDCFNVILDSKTMYTKNELDKLLKEFLARPVKKSVN